MKQKIKEVEVLRTQANHALILCLVPFVALILIGAVLGIVLDDMMFFILGICAGSVVFIMLSAFYYLPKKHRYINFFKSEIVKDCLDQVFDDVKFEPKEFFDQETIKKAYLVPIGNTYKGDDKITAVYKGVKFSQCDLNIQNVMSTGDSVTVEQYFLGKWIILDFEKKIDTYIQIREKELGGAVKTTIRTPKKAEKIQTESIEFNKNFSVFADDGHNAFYILTPHFMEALLKLKALVSGQIMLAFCQGKLHIALHNKKNAFEPNMSELKSSAYYNNIMTEILIITQIIDELIINLK